MKNYMTYKNYRGSVKYSAEDEILYGEIIGIDDSVSYEGQTLKELEADFHAAVDDYLELCKETGKTPQKEFKGAFNVRIPSELHKQAYYQALAEGISLNKFVEECIANRLSSHHA